MRFITKIAFVLSILITTQVHSAPTNKKSSESQTIVEQKNIIDGCRLIKLYALNEFCSFDESSSSSYLRAVVSITENYLIKVNTPNSNKMLCDLQKAGPRGYDAWCQKYGV